MTIKSKPATRQYRDGWEQTFSPKPLFDKPLLDEPVSIDQWRMVRGHNTRYYDNWSQVFEPRMLRGG